jgi:hypothetical protein
MILGSIQSTWNHWHLLTYCQSFGKRGRRKKVIWYQNFHKKQINETLKLCQKFNLYRTFIKFKLIPRLLKYITSCLTYSQVMITLSMWHSRYRYICVYIYIYLVITWSS